LGDPVIKVGQQITYKAGFVYKASLTTSDMIGRSPATNWLIVDCASGLFMASVATVVVVLTF